MAAILGLGCQAFADAQDATIPVPLEDPPQVTRNAPPLPEHPDRTPKPPETTRPKAAQSDRGELNRVRPAAQRMPIPAQPARDLPEIGAEPLTAEESETLLHFLPHTGPQGALQGEFVYTGESFHLAQGGLSNRRVTNYRGNVDMVFTLDLQRAVNWEGGRLFVYGQNVHGQTLSQRDVGDLQLFSNLDSTISDTDRPRYTAVAEYWYEQLLLDGVIRCKLGKQDANADFAYSDLGGDFVHSSFGLPPTIPLPTFPSQALGAAIFYAPTEELSLGIGAYDGTPASGPQGVRAGFDTLGHNGAILLGQMQWMGQSGPFGQLPSTVRAGGWYHSGDDLWVGVGGTPTQYGDNWGAWLIGDQMLWKEEYGTEDTQGLGAFCMLSWTKQDRNVISDSFAAGLVYRGFFDGRDSDVLGAGIAVANLSETFIADQALLGNPLEAYESATEVFYKYQLCPSMTLQPEVQIISHPGAAYRDAVLFGMRFEAVL